MNARDSQPRLSKRQSQVLLAVRERERVGASASVEYHIWKAGRDKSFWGPIALYEHLRKLTERGYLDRSGNRGNYRYGLSEKGKEALTDA